MKSKPTTLKEDDKPKGRARKASTTPKYVEDSDEDDEPPAKKKTVSKARGGSKKSQPTPVSTPSKRTPRSVAKVKYTDVSDSGNSDAELEVPVKKAKKAGGKRRR